MRAALRSDPLTAPAPLLLQGDCLALLPQLAAGTVDMVFADLPYGVTHNKWDVVIPFAPLWAELLRVGKRNCAFVFTATQPFATALICSQPKLFRYDLIWDKANPVGHLNANRQPMRRHEVVCVFGKAKTYNPQKIPGKAYSRGRRPANRNFGSVNLDHEHSNVTGDRHPHSIIATPSERNSSKHPTQKPVALLEWLVKTYSNPGDTVLDPTMGSGTTGVACANTGRGFIGIESSPTYYATAQKRICAAA